MKRIIVVLLLLLILSISSWSIFNYVSRDGEFTKWSHGTVGKDFFEEEKVIYMGYFLRWEGRGNPILKKIEFLKQDGRLVEENDDDVRVQPYVTTVERFGSIDEERVLEEGYDNELLNVNGFQVDQDFHLVLRVEYFNTKTNNDIATIRITYRKNGVTQTQYIPFDDGVVADE
ncbi:MULTISPECIES: hypothetical protein [Bacillus]|uniref:hypothetical protein n=1 Tax=Bacillus TaxID=1386 RepID=UPI000BB6C34D|nr:MULTISPECIES: hypothetical protein [Bacillus]